MSNINLSNQERLNFCNRCINKKEDDRFGTLCGLTEQKPHFGSSCKDFKENNGQVYKQQPVYRKEKREFKKEKSQKWVGLSVIITVILLGLKVVRMVSKLDSNTSTSSQYEYNQQKELERARKRRNKVATINYLSAKNRVEGFNRKMKTDTVLVLNPKIKLKLPKGFRLSIANDESALPVKATSRGYYFIYNKIKKEKNISNLNQWKNYRNSFINNYSGSQLIIKKPLTIDTETNTIERINFEIKTTYKPIKGVAKIVEYNNELYFLQLVSDASNADHSTIYKYLRYYVKTTM